MQLSAAGLRLIQECEGFRSTVYRDSAGLRTIGYGHRLQPGESFPNGITQQQAEEYLAKDVSVAEAAVLRLVRVPLTAHQFDALVDFVFNLGAGRLASSSLLRDLNAGRFDSAAVQLLRWDHCGAQENAGLKARREAEFRLFTMAVAPPLRAA